MEPLQHTCPYCGANLILQRDGSPVRCGDCGCLFAFMGDGSPDADMVTLTVEYAADRTLVIPDMHVTVGDREYEMPNRTRLEIRMPRGDYVLYFESTLRKKRYRVSMDGDRRLKVGRSLIFGAAAISEVAGYAEGFRKRSAFSCTSAPMLDRP